MISYPVDWYHQVPLHVKEILGTLQNAGFQALIVGGAVRDLWRERSPHDYDLVSSASVEEIAALFPKTLDIGKAFGIMVIVTDQGPVEVARFRTDGEYTDLRHPSTITFSSPEEDAKRRDFTINALFYDPLKGEVIDYVGGIKDLKEHRIRTVGDAEKRFQEDALRMLRAIRFHAQLEFSLEPSVLRAITKLSANLKAVSRERVTQEIEKIFSSARPFFGLQDLLLTGLWSEVFLTELPDLKNLETLERLEIVSLSEKPGKEFYLAMVAELCPDFKMEEAFLFPKEIFHLAKSIPELKKKIISFSNLDLAEKKNIFIQPAFASAYALTLIQNPHFIWLEQLPQMKSEWQNANKLNPAPLLTGKDLIANGFTPGPKMKTILEQIRRAQLNEEISNQEEALQLANKCS